MSSGYITIASILLYFLLLRTLDSTRMSPVKAAMILVITSYIVTSAVLILEYMARGGSPYSDMFSFARIITAAVQFGVAVGIFYKVEQSGDEYMSYALWGGLGLALLFYVAPMCVQMLLMELR